ncbi:alpha/beta fold hydrolase [Hymenobacter gummosus]|uniref:Alpha/beta fold hydrolase n=1 Tax=Hymenobacter gummosus TaxID=1776032 RepID=A0A3S0HA40_9BACT|nr:alpha/beta hydrolase [Hymenobacter gummosus]RTQ53467.1 alpha/beta fold hydrolase [Hymenobacter gummosus]
MKNFLRLLPALALLLLPLLAAAMQRKPTDSPLGGQWRGNLKVPGGTWELVVTIVPLSNGTLYATLDVPKQKISRMPVQAELKGADVTMRIEEAGSKFVGKLAADGKHINGTWTQPALTTALVLERTTGSVINAATFKPSLPYREEEVVVPNKVAKLRLTGTLTVPQGKGPFPAVVLISDSGPQDRNAVMDNYRMFNILADYLTRRGVAVLRYDDRGVGKSTGNYRLATTADLVSDAQAAMGFLRAHYKINKTQVGMVGHGEGANVALLAGADKNPPSFIVSLAGYGLSGPEVLKRQQVEIMRLIGANTQQVTSALQLHERMLSIIRETPSNDLARAKVSAMLRMSNADIDFTMVQARAAQLTSPWYRYFIDFDPQTKLGQVQCPVLALNGAADLLVPATKNLPMLQKGLKAAGNRKVETHKLPGVNHWFQSAQTDWPLVNGQVQPTFSPKALALIHGWVAQNSTPPTPAAAPELAKPAVKAANKRTGSIATQPSQRAAR